MKSVKRNLTVLILVSQMLTLNAYGATIDSVKMNAGKVIVSGETGENDVSYKIYGADTAGVEISEICEIGEVNTDNGKFSFEITMPEFLSGTAVDGEYIVEVKGENSDTKKFLFTAYSYQKEFVRKLNEKTSATQLLELFDSKTDDGIHNNIDVMNTLGADIEYYNGLSSAEKAKFANMFFEAKHGAVITAENFSDVYSDTMAVEYINKNKVDREWLEKSGLEFEGVAFSDAEEAVKKSIEAIMNSVGEYTSYSHIEKVYNEANVIYLLNTARFTDYDSLIEKYDSLIDIEKESFYKEYKKMSQSNKSKINTELKNELSSSPAESLDEFKEKYSDAVEEVKKNNKNNQGGGSSSGGGGGSSSGGGSSAAGGMNIISPEKSDPTQPKPSFSDISDVKWAEEAIINLATDGIVAGYEDNTFKPNRNIKREEFIKMVVSAIGLKTDSKECGFADVNQSEWYAPYINAAFENGFVSGVSATEFGIGRQITREDMAVIISRLLKDANAGENVAVFADDADISDYAKESVYKLYGLGKISGLGNNMFGPKQIVTRAQAAKIIYDTLVDGK